MSGIYEAFFWKIFLKKDLSAISFTKCVNLKISKV